MTAPRAQSSNYNTPPHELTARAQKFATWDSELDALELQICQLRRNLGLGR